MKTTTKNTKTVTAPETYKATIEIPATERSFGRRCHIDLDAEQTAEVQALADKCGLTLDAFVRSYVGGARGSRVKAFNYSRPPKVKLASVTFVVSPQQSHFKRLERAAALWGQTVEEFASESINNNIVGSEDIMLVNPRTGALLGEDTLGELLRGSEEFTTNTLAQQRGEDTAHQWLRVDRTPRASVVLDDHVSAIARLYLEGGAEHATAECIEDLVNAAVEFFCDDSDDGVTAAARLRQAKERRRGTVAQKGGEEA